jgi:hypothetical protein
MRQERCGGDQRGRVLQRGGLDFQVAKVPAAAMLGDGQTVRVPDQYASIRTDTNQPLGIVGSRYQVCQKP